MMGIGLVAHLCGFYCMGRVGETLMEMRDTGRTRFLRLAAYGVLAGVALAQPGRLFLPM